jgi:hypothetical protein
MSQPYATYSPEARTALQAQGRTDDQIADLWATTNPGFKKNIERIRQGAKSNPKATTAFLNYYLYGDAQYNQQANTVSPPIEDTSIGFLGSNALKRFLNKTWDYTQTDFQAKQAELREKYQSGEQGALNTMAQGALSTVSGIAGPAKALWEVGFTSDIPFTDTSIADVAEPAIQNVLESRPGQAAIQKAGQVNEYLSGSSTGRTVQAAGKAGFDALNLAGAGILERPFQGAKSLITSPIQSAKGAGKAVVQARPIEALRNVRSGKPSVGSVTTEAMKRTGVDERLATILTEGGSDTAAYKRILQSYEKAATDFRAPNPKEIVGETAIMTYRHLEDLRKGVGGMIGNVVKAHATEPLKLPNTYKKFVAWMEERGVYVSKEGKLERLGSSIPESDVRYLQGLHDDIAGISNFKQGDNIRRVIFKEQDLAKRQGIEFGDDAKQAAQAVHSSMLEEMGTAVPAYRVYATPYAKIRKAQNTFAQKLGKGSYKDIDLRKLRAGEIAKRMSGEASADMTDAFQLLEDTARSYGYEAGTSVRNQALFERAISRYFPTYSQGGLQGEVQAATMKTAVDAGLAMQTGSPYAIARVAGDVIKKFTGKTAEKQLKVIKDFLEVNADELAKATTPEQVETILQRMFGENYVPPAIRNAEVPQPSKTGIAPQPMPVQQGQGVPQTSTGNPSQAIIPPTQTPVNVPKAPSVKKPLVSADKVRKARAPTVKQIYGQRLHKGTYKGRTVSSDSYMAEFDDIPNEGLGKMRNDSKPESQWAPFFDPFDKAIPSKVIGDIPKGKIPSFATDAIVLEDKNGIGVISAHYDAYFRKKYGDISYRRLGENQSVYVEKNGELVGVIMPLRISEVEGYASSKDILSAIGREPTIRTEDLPF